jgi:hypothetical protein
VSTGPSSTTAVANVQANRGQLFAVFQFKSHGQRYVAAVAAQLST